MATKTPRAPRVDDLVIFAPNSASLMLYSGRHALPERGEIGFVTGSMKGPGGGLVYVWWQKTGHASVSTYDLQKTGHLPKFYPNKRSTAAQEKAANLDDRIEWLKGFKVESTRPRYHHEAPGKNEYEDDRKNPLLFVTPADRKKTLMAVYKRFTRVGDGSIRGGKHRVMHATPSGFHTYVLEDTTDAELHALATKVGVLTRGNPSTQQLDREVQSNLNSLQGSIPEGQYANVRHILTWLHRNEMDSIATYFVDSMKKGRDKFVRDFHLDSKVLGGVFSGKAGKAEVVKALKAIKEASWASVRENPTTGQKVAIAGGILAALGIGYAATRPTPTPGPQVTSNTPPPVPPAHEAVITSPPPGSPPDAPPVVYHESVIDPAPEAPAAPPTPPSAPPPVPPPVPGTAPHTGLVDRLSSSDAARQIFVFQALEYEWNIVGDIPDGLLGPITTGMIRSVDIQAGVTPSGNFRGATTIRRLVDVVMRANGGALPTPRILPFTLPRAVISQVNATGTRIGSPILLQIHAA